MQIVDNNVYNFNIGPTTVNMAINPLGGALAADVTGIDLAQDLGGNLAGTIRRAFLDHSVLVFRDQSLTPDQLLDFSRVFGDPVKHLLEGFRHPENPDIFVVSNVREDGRPKGAIYAGQYWHSDLSYTAEPARASMLLALEIPSSGGDTMFANMSLAYESLSPPLQTLLQGLRAVHDYSHAYDTVFSKLPGRPPMTEAERAKVPPVEHPVVRTHPDTGRKALFVNPGFTSRILGLTDGESDALLTFLFEHTTQPEFVYRHQWQPRDLVLWDNRCLMHRAVADYNMDENRHMHRATIAGEAPA